MKTIKLKKNHLLQIKKSPIIKKFKNNKKFDKIKYKIMIYQNKLKKKKSKR